MKWFLRILIFALFCKSGSGAGRLVSPFWVSQDDIEEGACLAPAAGSCGRTCFQCHSCGWYKSIPPAYSWEDPVSSLALVIEAVYSLAQGCSIFKASAMHKVLCLTLRPNFTSLASSSFWAYVIRNNLNNLLFKEKSIKNFNAKSLAT